MRGLGKEYGVPRSSAGLRIQQDSGCSLWMLHGQGLPWVCTSFPCQRQGRTNTAPPADSHTRNTSTIKLAFKQNSVIKKNKSRTHFFFLLTESLLSRWSRQQRSFTAPHLLHPLCHSSHLFPPVPLSHRCPSSISSQLPPILAAVPRCSPLPQVPLITPIPAPPSPGCPPHLFPGAPGDSSHFPSSRQLQLCSRQEGDAFTQLCLLWGHRATSARSHFHPSQSELTELLR